MGDSDSTPIPAEASDKLDGSTPTELAGLTDLSDGSTDCPDEDTGGPGHVLVVDDSAIATEFISRLLAGQGHTITSASSATEALTKAVSGKVDVVVCDLHMPDMDGFDVLSRLRALGADTPVIYVSVDDSLESVLRALHLRVFGYVLKGSDSIRLLPAVVRRALMHVRALRHNQDLGRQLRCANQQLEQRVADRTAQLQQAVQRLEAQERELRATLKMLEESREQALLHERLAALGMLAAGVAHDVNNPAAYVLSNLHAMNSNLKELRQHLDLLPYPGLVTTSAPPPAASSSEQRAVVGAYILAQTEMMVGESLGGVERILGIASDINQFARPRGPSQELVDLNEVVAIATRLLRNQIRHRARLELKLDEQVLVQGAHSRLVQVFVNLLSNAVYAITEGDRDGNRISVSTERTSRGILARVEDTGCGISESQLRCIQDPFFTTKPESKGTGLGLALCSWVVSEHGGSIQFASTVGEGTCVTVTLPPASDAAVAAEPDSKPTAQQPKGLRILVIDDEVELLRASRRELRAHNEVVVARGGAEALELLERDSAFDMVLCDMMMPDVDGPMVYAALEERWPNLAKRVVFVSGGAFTQRAQKFLDSVARPLMTKPIRPDQLTVVYEQLPAPSRKPKA